MGDVRISEETGLLAGTDVANQIGSTSPEENECSSSCQHKNRTKQSPGFVQRVNAKAFIPEEASFAHNEDQDR